MTIKTIETVGRALIRFIEEFGLVMFLLLATLAWMLRPPLRLRAIFKQMEFVGVNSLMSPLQGLIQSRPMLLTA